MDSGLATWRWRRGMTELRLWRAPRMHLASRNRSAPDRRPRCWSGCLTAIGLDPIAVGIDNERRVVVCAVIGTQPRLAVVAAAVRDRCLVKGVDALACRGREAEMQPGLRVGRHWTRAGADPERDPALPVAEGAFGSAETRIAERLECGVVERLGFRDVVDADGYMVDHIDCPSPLVFPYAV